jgi:uncharacterized membrane protein YgcG
MPRACEGLAAEELQASPWNVTPEVSDSHVIMTISWSRAQEVAEIVLGLAATRGLVCFDPHASVVHNPSGQADRLRLEFADGGLVDRPDPAALGALLHRRPRGPRSRVGQGAGRGTRAGGSGGHGVHGGGGSGGGEGDQGGGGALLGGAGHGAAAGRQRGDLAAGRLGRTGPGQPVR